MKTGHILAQKKLYSKYSNTTPQTVISAMHPDGYFQVVFVIPVIARADSHYCNSVLSFSHHYTDLVWVLC